MNINRTTFAVELAIPTTATLSSIHPFSVHGHVAAFLPIPTTSTSTSTRTPGRRRGRRNRQHSFRALIQPTQADFMESDTRMKTFEEDDVEVAKGYTMTQFCDKMIEYFLQEKPQTKDWRKILVFRDDWKKYRDSFFNRCRVRADGEKDPSMKKKLTLLARKMKKIDDEIEKNSCLLKEIQDNPVDLNAIVARRREEFNGEFFRYLNVLSDNCDGLEDRDAMARLGAKCLSAVRVYDSTVEHLDSFEFAQTKFDDILNSSSTEAALEKINRLAKAKELDSSLILLINKAWAATKESTTMKNEVKDIMHHIYRGTRKALKSMAPPEIKLLRYLLNIVDPEERFSALATAFSPGEEHEPKDANALYTTPKELHKWIKMMLDAYHLNKEETDLMEARQMSDPMIIQRLLILKETVETEYMKQENTTDKKELEHEPEAEE
ncbi:hypothetical protein KSP39_PZI023944 [Platanthera zijinensis]|uniref:Uncharacterized protein n=1 Tax=Platanthera zijinensis TaxID=2320716 RepID=A0AAP0FTC5_9ASPA